jgi:hypothetical protein
VRVGEEVLECCAIGEVLAQRRWLEPVSQRITWSNSACVPWLVSLGQRNGSRTITGTPYVARGKSREVTFSEEHRGLGRGAPKACRRGAAGRR